VNATIQPWDRFKRAQIYTSLIALFGRKAWGSASSGQCSSLEELKPGICSELKIDSLNTSFSFLLGTIPPRINVLKHLYFMFVLRCFTAEAAKCLANIVPRSGTWHNVKGYVNVPSYARLRLPLLTDSVLARALEVMPNLAAVMSVYSPWVKNMKFDANAQKNPYTAALTSPDVNNVIDKWLEFRSDVLNVAVSNPFLTRDSAQCILQRLSLHAHDTSMRSNYNYSVDCIARLCMNINIPVDFFKDFSELVSSFLCIRPDFPKDKIQYNPALLYANSPEYHTDRYIAEHLSPSDRLTASRHPNMSEKTYSKLLSSKRCNFVSNILLNDRTDTFSLLRFQQTYPFSVGVRFDIERLNRVLMPVLERQFKAAENYDTFFPKTIEEFNSVLESFVP
jgi:hypothetical protein